MVTKNETERKIKKGKRYLLFPNGKTSGTVEKFRSVKENPGRFSIILKNQNY